MVRSVVDIKAAELRRLDFMIDRDGLTLAYNFARQTYQVYRAQRKLRPMKYGSAYRNELIVSCVVLRQFVREATKRLTTEPA